MRRTQMCVAGFLLVAMAAWGFAKSGGAWESKARAASQHGTVERAASEAPTFYRDVLPILQGHCESCHRADGIAPMAFRTYEETQSYAAAIRNVAENKSMPPWFAVPGIGHFSNDPSLTPEQIAALAAWVDANTPAGDARDAPLPVHWAENWTIRQPDLIVKMAKGVPLPAAGDVDYTYEIVPTHFV